MARFGRGRWGEVSATEPFVEDFFMELDDESRTTLIIGYLEEQQTLIEWVTLAFMIGLAAGVPHWSTSQEGEVFLLTLKKMKEENKIILFGSKIGKKV